MKLFLIYSVLLITVKAKYAAANIFTEYSELFKNISEFSENAMESYTKGLFSDSQRRCYDDVMYVLQHLSSKWSIQMLDAAGKMPSGALLGNGLWMGKYRECREVQAPPDDKRGVVIRGLYCVATWNVSVPTNFHMPLHHLPIKTGLCLPSSCDKLDIERDIKIIMYFIHRLPFVQGHLLHLNSLSCKGEDPPLSPAGLMFLYILGVYSLLILIGSSVTITEYALGATKLPEHSSPPANGATVCTEFADNADHLASDEDRQLCGTERRQYSLLHKLSFRNGIMFLKCFCLFSNAAKILDTTSNARNFPCIHGIRFLSMAWVILGHTYVHNLNVIGNFMDLLHSIDNLPFQVISQGTFSVDTFFLISGFLLGYLYLEESDKRKGNISWLALILHRVLRIVPVYGVLLAFNVLIFPHTNSGPFWGEDTDQPACGQRWWWNVIFINNFLKMDDMCMTWTWYLANDFQFFLFGLLLLHILCVWRYPRVCFAVGGITLVGSILLTGCISYAYNLMPLFSGIANASDYDAYKNSLVLTWDLLYTKPYCRIGPYLVGLGLACFLYRTRNQVQPLKLKYKLVGWLSSSLCCLGVIYGVYFMKEDGAILPHVYNALARTSFSLGVAWVIYCCIAFSDGMLSYFTIFGAVLGAINIANGAEKGSFGAGLVSRLLSCRAWVPLSRLSFCAYLLHPLLMSWYFESRDGPVHFNHTNRVMLYFAFTVVSYAAAFVTSITFEAPIINIEKMLRKNTTNRIEPIAIEMRR